MRARGNSRGADGVQLGQRAGGSVESETRARPARPCLDASQDAVPRKAGGPALVRAGGGEAGRRQVHHACHPASATPFPSSACKREHNETWTVTKAP